MELIYKIDFNTTNFYYVNIINRLITEFKITATAKLYRGFILLRVDDDAQVIEEFFKYLESKLPISVFVGQSQVLSSFDESITPLEDKGIEVSVSYTNEAILDLLKEQKKEVALNESEIVIENRLYTSQSKEEEEVIFMTNIMKISEYFSLNQKQMQLLSAIERPFVKLEINFAHNKNNEFGNRRFVYVRFAKTKEEILISQALKEQGIDYLFTKDAPELLKMTYNENENIILSGEEGVYPRYDYELDKTFEHFSEYVQEVGSLFKVCIIEKNKRTTPAIGVNFSKRGANNDIAVYMPTSGVKSIIKVPNIHLDLEHMFEEIAEIDENCARLIGNYQKKFSIENRALKECNGFEAIFEMIALIIGLKSAKALEELALSANIQSGLKIDMVVEKIDGVNYLDYRRIVQSIMSYKMADVDNTMLCFSLYESLVDLITENITKIENDVKTKEVVITGDLWENKIYCDKLKKALKNYNILISNSNPISL